MYLRVKAEVILGETASSIVKVQSSYLIPMNSFVISGMLSSMETGSHSMRRNAKCVESLASECHCTCILGLYIDELCISCERWSY